LANQGKQRVVGTETLLVQRGGELFGQTDPLIELPHDQQPGITRKPPCRIFDIQAFFGMKFETFRPNTL
jgi:hypothetical protein